MFRVSCILLGLEPGSRAADVTLLYPVPRCIFLAWAILCAAIAAAKLHRDLRVSPFAAIAAAVVFNEGAFK